MFVWDGNPRIESLFIDHLKADLALEEMEGIYR
jgi:hypothetical protein